MLKLFYTISFLLIAFNTGFTQESKEVKFPKNPLDSLTSYLLNNKEYLDFYPTIFPFNNSFTISSDYGNRIHPISKKKQFHSGIDFTCPKGTNVIAPAHGRVNKVIINDPVVGNSITISHLNLWSTSYSHLDSISVVANQLVSKYDPIGTTGATGSVTGNHLHFAISYNKKKLDPLPYCYLATFIKRNNMSSLVRDTILVKSKIN